MSRMIFRLSLIGSGGILASMGKIADAELGGSLTTLLSYFNLQLYGTVL